MSLQIDSRRIRVIRSGHPAGGPVLYWMSRDQRVRDNWALLHAQEMALRYKQPLAVAFCLTPTYLDAAIRQFGFMLRGLEETERDLQRLKIPFFLLTGSPPDKIRSFITRHRFGLLVTDFSPLHLNRNWVDAVAETTHIPFHQVDAHNIVPVWEASDKQEFAAYTFRPKLRALLPAFLTNFPRPRRHPHPWPEATSPANWKKAWHSLRVDRSIEEVNWLTPGPRAGAKVMRDFLNTRLEVYADLMNNPIADVRSGLSPYFHFGQIAPQRVALETQRYDQWIASQEAFLEQLIVRRELADNFCWYNRLYDTFDGLPEWGRTTLNEHRFDPRPRLFTREQFERGVTGDELWNAAQCELVIRGTLHGYLRMYWAKKILEWSRNPEEALGIAIYLNDRYQLDGRDPNGYVGIAWSIGGLHDRAFSPRDIYGKIRYMSFGGAKRKFNVATYIDLVDQLNGESAA